MSIQETLKNVQLAIKVNKTKYNQHGKYYYRSLEDIFEGVKPALKEYGCTITVQDSLVEAGGRVYIKATASLHTGGETISVDGYALHAENQKGMMDAQLTGSTSSYARKYALSGLLLLDDNEDADDLNDHGKGQQSTPAPSSKPAQAKITLSHVNALAGKVFDDWGSERAKELAKSFGLNTLRDANQAQIDEIFEHLRGLTGA